MAWPVVRAEIARVLRAVEITEPAQIHIAHVYEHPPRSVGEAPVFVIIPPTEIEITRGNDVRTETASVPCRYIDFDDGDTEYTAEIAAAFREAVIAAFDVETTLRGTGYVLDQSVDGIILDKYAGRDVVTFETVLTVRHDTFTEIS